MKQYKVTINYSTTISANDEEDAVNRLFEDIESTPQQTLDNFIFEHTNAKELSYQSNTDVSGGLV